MIVYERLDVDLKQVRKVDRNQRFHASNVDSFVFDVPLLNIRKKLNITIIIITYF